MKPSDKWLAYMGKYPKRIPHWEHWSNPDAETYLTGIDYYQNPRRCRQRMNELYPELSLPIFTSDDPLPKPTMNKTGKSADHATMTVRWGDGQSGTWEHGEAFFRSPEDVFAFSPLEKGDFTDWPHVVNNRDYSSEHIVWSEYAKGFSINHTLSEYSTASVGFYNTMFMWPLLTFGWELFMETCLDERFARIMDEFAEINRRVFKAFAKLPVRFVICHDDIVTSRGPVCSPEWMHRYIFPRYEEFFGIVKAAGKEVIFMADGCMDAFADDIFACGARGLVTEPYTDFKKIAKKHKDCMLAGEGDNRVLYMNCAEKIESMVKSMVETAFLTGGYMMCIGNHIPWDVPGEAVKRYLDASARWAVRA